LALPRPESRPTSSFPGTGLDVSGVLMPMEVGVPRNCCWYAAAAASPALVALALALALVPAPLLLVLLLLLLLLHAPMASAEVATAMTAASVRLIRASF
jgi:hypothetical protein